jgi:replicative DNA helicase
MQINKLSSYGHAFQTKVISALLTHKELLVNINDILTPEYFDNKADQWIIEQIIKYYNKYHTTPTMDVLNVETKKVDNDIMKIAVVEQLREAYKLSDSSDLKYVEEEFSSFCTNQQLKQALLSSVDLLNIGQYNDIRNLINNALKAGQDKNVGLEYDKDIETRYRNEDRNTIPFPWKTFNNITQGGYGKGDLVLVFGNPKGGKSWAIIAMAAEAVKLGYNITFYALELGESYVGKRFDAYFTGIPVDKLDERRAEVEEIVGKLAGKLVIKGFPPKRASLDNIEAHQQKLKDQNDFTSDGIFIDYLDLLRNRKSRKERKDDIDDVYTDAKGLAVELGVPIISPSQANRSGAEKEILESSHIAGSFDKIMIGDIVISLARGRKDKLNGTGRWHVMGNRYGLDGVTYYSPKIDTSTGHIVIDENPMDVDETGGSSSASGGVTKDEKTFIKNKFFKD